MAAGKEIRTQIGSIKNTQKITSAMEMVAASKMRKAQERMTASQPYARQIRNVVGHIANANPEYRHDYMVDREVKRVASSRSEANCENAASSRYWASARRTPPPSFLMILV